jgi:two-component system phosphate regulon response regulator PhoB
MLPEIDGLEVCRRLRRDAASAAVPIIMLTAKAEEVDRVVGLEMGADDYLAKPFSPKELVARVRAILRRTRPAAVSSVLRAGTLALDRERHVVTLDEKPVALTPKEFDLLLALLESTGRVLSREQLLNRVWGYARADEIESRTVDVHVRRLRAKLGGESRRIGTLKGVGYRFEVD